MSPASSSRDHDDVVDHVHAANDLAEDRVTGCATFAIGALFVVGDVDEKLIGRAVRIVGAGHGKSAAGVGKAVAGFVANGGLLGADLAHAGEKAAPLGHETRNDAVEDRA